MLDDGVSLTDDVAEAEAELVSISSVKRKKTTRGGRKVKARKLLAALRTADDDNVDVNDNNAGEHVAEEGVKKKKTARGGRKVKARKVLAALRA